MINKTSAFAYSPRSKKETNKEANKFFILYYFQIWGRPQQKPGLGILCDFEKIDIEVT